MQVFDETCRCNMHILVFGSPRGLTATGCRLPPDFHFPRLKTRKCGGAQREGALIDLPSLGMNCFTHLGVFPRYIILSVDTNIKL